MSRSDGLLQAQHRMAEVTAVVYMGAHVGVYGRLFLGVAPDRARTILLYSAATAFYLAAFHLAAVLWREGRGFWSLTLTLALAAQLVSSTISLALHVRGNAGVWEEVAGIIAGPMTQLYVWSLFVYSLVRAGMVARDGLSRSGLILSMRDSALSTVLTAVAIAALPLLVVLSALGAVQIDVAGAIISFADFWNPLIYVLLFSGYLMLYRVEGAATLRYLSYLFFVSVASGVIGGLSSAVGAGSALGGLLHLVSLMLPAAGIYLWLRAVQEA
ncbi:MAG: hypothetical protein R6U70_06620 [Bacillota bacterium]